MTLTSHQFSVTIILLCTINQLLLNVKCEEIENSGSATLRIMQEFQLQNIIGNYLKTSENDTVVKLINSECWKQISIVLDGIKNYESWAMKILDASSKIPSGILEGNIIDVGMYDECISATVTNENTTIVGRHCIYTLSGIIPKSQFTIEPMLSVCLPAACDNEDVNNLLQSGINTAMKYINYSNLTVKSVTCTHSHGPSWGIGAIMTVSLLGFLLCFFIICTICQCVMDTNENNKELTVYKVLREFSLYTNSKRILDTSVSNNNLSAVSGLRFFSTCWIVLGHTYYNGISELIVNRLDTLTWVRSWTTIYVLIGHLAVNTFLVISSVLVSYLFFSMIENKQKWNIISFYGHRYLKLTPSLCILLLLTIYIFPYVGSGPMWESSMTIQSNYCMRNWWRILLYIQNYGSNENLMCLGYTWYLAVDMQLFFLSPIILIPLLYKKELGLIIIGLLTIISMIIPAVISVTNKYSTSLLFKLDAALTADMMLYYYVPTYTRAGPYLMGLLTGYLLKYNKNASNAVLIAGWVLTVFSLIFSISSWRIFQMDSYDFNMYWEIFYNAFAQHIWSFAICWIIYVSNIEHGGIISSFLSLPFFVPFTRLTYAIYLVHFVIQTMEIHSTRVPKYFSNYSIITTFISDFVLSIVTAFIFHLLFESPYLAVKKILTKRGNNNNATKTVNNIATEANNKISEINNTSN